MNALSAATVGPATRFLDALLAHDRPIAQQVVRDLLATTDLTTVYVDVLQPAMYELGARWERGEVTVAQEHFVTAATQQVMAILHAESFAPKPDGRRMLAASVGGNLHSIGIRMVTDVFELHGWTTMFVGADTPTEAILQTLSTNQFDVLAVSAALSDHLAELAALIAAVRSIDTRVRILIGGRALQATPERWRELGADGYAATPSQAVTLAEALVAPPAIYRPLTLVVRGPHELVDEARTLAAMGEINTELHDMARVLAAKNGELETVNAQLNRVMAVIAHDLRNPLSVITHYTRFLREDLGPTLGDEQREFLAYIDSSSEFMRTLLDDLLDVARLRAGKLTLVRTEVDLAELARGVVALNQHLAQRKTIAVEVHTSEPVLFAQIDRSKLQQVVANLVGNATKYSLPGTSVAVELARTGGAVTLSVRDRGIGIAAADLSKVFQPFGTAATQGTAGEKSTGLGLTIARAIVEAHDGTLDVESVLGKGSVFTVKLPVTAPAPTG